MKRRELTQKQELFALAYIETGNASEAYRRAYDAGRMKPETVNRKAFDLLQNGNLTARVAELRQAASDKAVVSEARVIEELARIGLFDPGHLFADDGSLLPVKKMPPAVRAAIASVEVEELFDGDGKGRKRIGYIRKVKLWDKNSAADKLLRHLGSYERTIANVLVRWRTCRAKPCGALLSGWRRCGAQRQLEATFPRSR